MADQSVSDETLEQIAQLHGFAKEINEILDTTPRNVVVAMHEVKERAKPMQSQLALIYKDLSGGDDIESDA